MIVLTSASLVRNSGDGNEVVAGLRVGATHFCAIACPFKVLLKSHHCIICRLKWRFEKTDAKGH